MTQQEFSELVAYFMDADRDTISNTASTVLMDLLDTADDMPNIFPLAVKVGVNRNGSLNNEEEVLLQDLLDEIWYGYEDDDIEYDIEEFLVNKIQTTTISAQAYTHLAQLISTVNDVTQYRLLALVFAFAFIDSVPDKSFIDKMNQIWCGGTLC